MPHALARRRRHARDVGHDGLGNIVADVFGRGLLVGAADLADHDDALGGGIIFEQFETVDKIQSPYGVSADADAGGLPEAIQCRLIDRLVR